MNWEFEGHLHERFQWRLVGYILIKGYVTLTVTADGHTYQAFGPFFKELGGNFPTLAEAKEAVEKALEGK